MQNPWGTNQASGGSKSNPPKIQSFIESLKNNPNNGGFSRPEGSFNSPFSELNKQKEIEKQRVAQFHQARLREWEHVYSAKDKQIQRQIESIREELKALVKQIVKYDQSIKTAVEQEVVSPGAYHVSFFEHIKLMLSQIRKNVQSANSWLSLYNRRRKQKGAFMDNAKSGGSAYMFSNEHSVTRSVG